MKISIWGLVLLLFMHSFSLAALTITHENIATLNLPYTLDDLLEWVDTKLSNHDRILRMQRTWKIIQAYNTLRSLQEELKLLSVEKRNLQQLYDLAKRKQQRASMTDSDVLQAHNAVIAREIALIKKREECRSSIMEILQLCIIEVIFDDKKTASKSSDQR